MPNLRSRRQSRRLSDFADAADDHSDQGQGSFTASMVASLMESAQRSQADAFERLLDRVLERQPTPAPCATGNFSKRPPHKIYRQIDKMRQGMEKTDVFVARARALLTKLPHGDLSEKVQLDMVYGLLDHRIRKRIRREDVTTFSQLLKLARTIEEEFDPPETPAAAFDGRLGRAAAAPATPLQPPPRRANVTYNTPPSFPRMSTSTPMTRRASVVPGDPSDAVRRSNASYAPRPAPPTELPTPCVPKSRFCGYCKIYGHVRENCSRLINKSVGNENSANVVPQINCYGCGRPGVVSVPNFDQVNVPNFDPVCDQVSVPNFDQVNVANFDPVSDHVISAVYARYAYATPTPRPILTIEICGYTGTGFIDSAAKCCVAGSKLYSLLKGLNHPFTRRRVNVKLADGDSGPRNVLVARVEVHVSFDRVVITEFVIFPDAQDNDTLLGVNFLAAAGMVVDFETQTWHFSGCNRTYPLEYEADQEPSTAVVASSILLRDEEGAMLTSEDRQRLADLTTGMTPSYMTFAREMRTPFDVQHDLRTILENDNFVPQVTPYLRKFVSSLREIHERVEKKQDARKDYADQSRRPSPGYEEGDLVLLTTHALSNASKGLTRKFMPQRDGPYFIKSVVSPTTYDVVDAQGQVLGRFHSSDLTPFVSRTGQEQRPVQPRRLRGRPRVRQETHDTPPSHHADAESYDPSIHTAGDGPPNTDTTHSANSQSGRPCELEEEGVARGNSSSARNGNSGATANGNAAPACPQPSANERPFRPSRSVRRPERLNDFEL
ncbi:hypothetical protein NE865_10118 [Phthorimaea operculella]|nr:hypothetical protein NE865_10118 [Phthorimaea operculella]